VERGEGGDGIGEEHHPVARDEQVERGAGCGDGEDVAFDEVEINAARGALAGDRQLCGRQVDAGDVKLRPRRGEREAGRAGAAADVERAAGFGGEVENCRVEPPREIAERAVGALPFRCPGAADAADPVMRFGRWGLSMMGACVISSASPAKAGAQLEWLK